MRIPELRTRLLNSRKYLLELQLKAEEFLIYQLCAVGD